jgi:hypothetical protein
MFLACLITPLTPISTTTTTPTPQPNRKDISTRLRNEFATKYLENINVYPTKQSIDQVLQHIDVDKAIINANWSRGILTITPSGFNSITSDLKGTHSHHHSHHHSHSKPKDDSKAKNLPKRLQQAYTADDVINTTNSNTTSTTDVSFTTMSFENPDRDLRVDKAAKSHVEAAASLQTSDLTSPLLLILQVRSENWLCDDSATFVKRMRRECEEIANWL